MSEYHKNKIALFVCDDLVGLEIVNKLIPEMQALGIEPAIYNTGSKLNRKFKIPSPDEVRFYGVELLRDLVIPTVEKQPCDKEKLKSGLLGSYKQLAEVYGVDYQDVDDVNNPDFVKSVVDDKDLMGGISIRFLQIFEPEVINAFNEKGFMWNIHGGILPQYKGLLIPAWAMANGEDIYGWTLYKIDPGIDTGEILATGHIPLDPKQPIFKIYQDMIPTGIDMLKDGLTQFVEQKQNLTGNPQIDGDNPDLYYTYPTAEQWADFKKQGVRFSDPSETIADYLEKFAAPGTEEYKKLRLELIKKVSEFEAANDSSADAGLGNQDDEDCGYGQLTY